MGSEFSREDIITFCQFTDIANEQKKWDEENDKRPEHEQEEEWKNPYFGFPQMVRFAFRPSKSALALLENLKNRGTTYAFSALLKPESLTKKEDGSHKTFRYEKEVLELFEAIDGSKDEENVLAFLDYDKIKEGNMCRHIVCVLPYCASCDALEELLSANAGSFKNLGQYKIINISGVDAYKKYKTVASVKREIANCEKDDKKTLTLTVNRMLTGSTVEQWDTMIFLKDTASPQEYDQAIFRLQNQYIVKYQNDKGEEINYNMKPQTLLVDFDPHRMFTMQEQKSLIYNINTETAGNQHLKKRMEEELNISPIITLNKNKIEQVDAADILARISEYSSSRGVRDEALDIPVDSSLFQIEEIVEEIERQAEIGSKGGLQIEAYKDNDGSDFEEPDDEQDELSDGDLNSAKSDGSIADTAVYNKEMQALENKFRTYYSRLLFFAFLTENKVSSVDDILANSGSEDDARILKNLQLDRGVLANIRKHINPFILSRLDYKIQNINSLAHDDSVPSIERALTAMNKFGKLSESEVTTPIQVAEDMVALLPDDCFKKIDSSHKILDIASKAGEFAIAICKRCERMGISTDAIQDAVLSIPTSSVAYEFTRKMYKILGLDIKTIASNFRSYDLLNLKDDDINYQNINLVLSQKKDFCDISLTDDVKKEGGFMKFNAVVGNPPYQESDGGAQASARPIYPFFVNLSRDLKPDCACIIMPARWYTGGKGGKDMDAFRVSMLDDIHIKELHDFLHPEVIFPDTNNRGGICYFLWDRQYDNSKSKTKVVTHKGNSEIEMVTRFIRTEGLEVFIRSSEAINIIHKVIVSGATDVMSDHISPRKPFGIESNIIHKPEWHDSESGLCEPLKCVGKGKKFGFVESSLIHSHRELIDVWKVFTPRANNVGTELNDDNLNTLIGEPKTICTEAYIVIGGDLHLDKNRAKNLANYFKTKFVRFMHGLAKASHDATSKTYRFVPTQDFSEEWTDEKLYQKYGLTQEEINYIENSIKPMD